MGATSPEEIAKQHAEACAIMDIRTPCAPRVDRGEVPMRWKERPTADAAAADAAAVSVSVSPRRGGNANPNSPEEGVEVMVDDGAKSGRHRDEVEWCISSRGQVDVSPIVELISEGVNEPASSSNAAKSKKKGGGSGKDSLTSAFSPGNLWDERNAAQNNVRITRPSHDAWGIKKIVLVFCDDFLHTIYTLPWYQKRGKVGKQMHAAVQPVLDALGIQQDQLVRCLLAGLPPGVTIPVHHDTGEWVRRTHRVHVPVILSDPGRVLFRCGPTERAMERVDCSPGHVFEMNNQAKHAVTNADPNGNYRVHLILDYVHPSFLRTRSRQNCPCRRVDLGPGEVVTQTRRSIDRALDAGTRRHPRFLILGAQKAGTTSLYEYVNQHPWVVRAKRRETHCLDWRWEPSLPSAERRRGHCLNTFYHAQSMGPYPSLVTGDSTPSYLLDYFRVIPRLKECFPHGPQLIVMTRDPIRRAVSHYAMVTSADGTTGQVAARGTEWRGKSPEEVFQQDVRNMKDDGLLPYWDVEAGTLDKESFDAFVDTREEDAAWERYVTTRIPLNTGSYSPLARGLYALQCRQWFRSFAMDKFLVMKLEDMSSSSSDGAGDGKGVQWAVDRTMEHLGLPQFRLLDVEKKNAREYEDPLEGDEELRGWLERFFAPHNERFGRMMVEEMGYDKEDWMGVWSYDKA